MDETIVALIRDCGERSLAGTMIFPQVVAALSSVGVERYHADYSRSEITFYLASGESTVVPASHEAAATANEFSAAGVEAAIRASQRGAIKYEEFIRLTKAAGCIGYFVQITGRRAIYFGRNGESHVEPFPAAPVK